MPWLNPTAFRRPGTKPSSGASSFFGPPERRGFRRLWQFRNIEEISDAELAHQGPLCRDRKVAQVEAVLFLVREPLTSRKIAQLANLADGTEARKLLRRLKLLLETGESAFQVAEVAGGYQLLTRPELSPWLRRHLQTPYRQRLSGPAMETLAVVAYRQPILRAEIEAIRGVQCDDILRQLLDRDFIRIIGRSEDLGRPLLYGTTRRFLELFGLRNLDELPHAVHSHAAAKGDHSESADCSDTSQSKTNPGAGQADDKITTDSIPEEKSVTTRIRHAQEQEQELGDELAPVALNPRLQSAGTLMAAKDEDEEEADEDDDWEDDDDEEDDEDDDEEDEDDDFVDEEWEEVDDEEEDDEEDEDDEDEEDWEEEEDDDWEDDDEDDDEEWEEEDGAE
jgi:segregation and condensation protein B